MGDFKCLFIDNWREYDVVLSRLGVHQSDCWKAITPNGDSSQDSPILAAKFANCMAYRHFIAIANEDGQIAIQNTNLTNDSIEEQTVKGQQCHNNAVFDVEWMPGQMQLVSASGK